MRQTIKEIEVNMAYRWFLGLELFMIRSLIFLLSGKNYTRRFKRYRLIRADFPAYRQECYRFKLVDSTEIFC